MVRPTGRRTSRWLWVVRLVVRRYPFDLTRMNPYIVLQYFKMAKNITDKNVSTILVENETVD